MEKIIIAGILVKNEEGKILLVKTREKAGVYAGTYTIPAAEVETGVLADEAVQTSLFVQTGIKVKNIKRVVFDDEIVEEISRGKIHQFMLIYTGEYFSGELKKAGDRNEYEGIKWFAPEELPGLKLSSPLQKLLAVIGKWKNKFMFLYGLYVQSSS